MVVAGPLYEYAEGEDRWAAAVAAVARSRNVVDLEAVPVAASVVGEQWCASSRHMH